MRHIIFVFGLVTLVLSGKDDGKDKDKDKGKYKTCKQNELQCNNENCIPRDEICDGEDDCDDGSDEPPIIPASFCPKCVYGSYRCINWRCIPGRGVCNGYNECGDWSDEINCPPTYKRKTENQTNISILLLNKTIQNEPAPKWLYLSSRFFKTIKQQL